jgi:hypothetical protein
LHQKLKRASKISPVSKFSFQEEMPDHPRCAGHQGAKQDAESLRSFWLILEL